MKIVIASVAARLDWRPWQNSYYIDNETERVSAIKFQSARLMGMSQIEIFKTTSKQGWRWDQQRSTLSLDFCV